MTSPIIPSYGRLTQLISNASGVHRKLDQLTRQASSGLVSDTYAGLGARADIPLDLHPQLTALQTWQSNISAAAGRLQVTQSALTRLQQIASGFNAQLNNLNGLNPQNVDVIAASARDALTQVAGLVDSRDGGVYVFAGQDTANPPVPNPDNITTSSFYTQIALQVGNLSAQGAATTAQNTYNIAQTSPPFSGYLTSTAPAPQVPVVQVGQNQTEPTGVLANQNSFVASPVQPPALTGGPAPSTGSYTTDLMRALATIGSLSSSQANDPNFAGLIQDTRASLGNAINTMGADAGALGNVQSGLTATATRLSSVATAVTAQVSSAEDVDMAATLSNLTQVQTQLQASYQLISGLSGLSLVKFLPAG